MDIQKPKTQIEGVQLDFSSVKELGERWEKLPKHQKSYSIAGITAGISGLVACAISTGGIALIPILGTLGAYSVPMIGGLIAGGIAKQGYSDSKPLIPEHKDKHKVKFGDITTTLMTSASLLIGVGFATSGAGLSGVLLSMYELFITYSTQIALIGTVAICNQGLIKKTVGVDMLAMVSGGINQLAGEASDKVVIEPKKVDAVEPVIKTETVIIEAIEPVEDFIDSEVISFKQQEQLDIIAKNDAERLKNAKSDTQYKSTMQDTKDCETLLKHIKINKTVSKSILLKKISWGLEELNRVMDLAVQKGHLIRDEAGKYLATEAMKEEYGILEIDRTQLFKTIK